MSCARPFVAWPLLLAAWLPGCGADAPEEPASSEEEAEEEEESEEEAEARRLHELKVATEHIAMLVPKDTVAYVQLQSLARFDEFISRLARANATLGRSFDEIGRALHRNLPGDERYLEAGQPIGIAISLPVDREPALTYVLPMKDVASFKRSLQISPHMPQPVFDGTYLAVTDNPLFELPREPVALAKGEVDRSLVVRADLARLDRRFGSQLRLALAALESGADPARLGPLAGDPRIAGVLQLVADPLLYALAVGQQVEVTCELEADRIALNCAMLTRDAGVLSPWTSSPAVDLAPLARALVASDTFAFVGGCNPEVLTDRLASMLTPTESQRQRAAELLGSFSDLFGSLGAVSASLTPGESHIALHVKATDDPGFAHNLASTFELFSLAGLGVEVQSKTLQTIEGIEVEELLVHFDADAMTALTGERTEDLPAVQLRLDAVARSLFGSGSVRVRIARFGERGLIAISNDEVWFRRTLLWSGSDKDLTPPDVRGALEHLGAAPAAAVLRFDMARWMQDHEDWTRQWRALAGPVRDIDPTAVGAVHAIDPEPLTLHLGAEGRTLRIGMSLGLTIERSAQMAAR